MPISRPAHPFGWQFTEIQLAVMATSPNFHDMSRPAALTPTPVVE
jgi:hypothetical protein